jgi:hypothetical protein
MRERGLSEQLGGVMRAARKERVWERIEAEIGTREAELAQEALDALSRVAHKRASGDAFGWTGIGRDAQHARRAVEPATVEDRAPIEPQGVANRRQIGHASEEIVEARWRPGVVWHDRVLNERAMGHSRTVRPVASIQH